MGAFSAEVAASEVPVVVLRYLDPRAGQNSLEARVAPGAGANLFSLKVGGQELLEQPPSLAELATSMAGTPVMFPTPNRVRDSTFEFDGRRYHFAPNSGSNFIHGLVRRRPWQVDAPATAAASASASMWLEWNQSQPDFELFPLVHRISLTYTLRRRGLGIDYAILNHGPARLPFGFGLHPWFRVPGDRTDVFLRIPAAQRMEAEDRLPTGKLLPVAGTSFDLREATPLQGLDLDDVYCELDPAAAPSFEWRSQGIQVILDASAVFSHVVVYTPPGRPVFCIENQTCSTDAHNLHARGFRRQSHLQVVQPGKTARGRIDWQILRGDARSDG